MSITNKLDLRLQQARYYRYLLSQWQDPIFQLRWPCERGVQYPKESRADNLGKQGWSFLE